MATSTVSVISQASSTLNKASVSHASEMQLASGWFRGDKKVTLNGADVSEWGDIVSTNKSSQGAAADQPLFVSSAINSNPGLTFDGSTEYLEADFLASVFSGTDPTWSVAFAMQWETLASGKRIWSVGNSGDSNPFIELRTETGVDWRLITRDDAASSDLLDVSGASAGAQVHVITSTGTTVTWWIDNTKAVDAGTLNVGARTLDQMHLAALAWSTIAGHANITMTEFAAWDSELSATQVGNVGTYLAKRTGTSW